MAQLLHDDDDDDRESLRREFNRKLGTSASKALDLLPSYMHEGIVEYILLGRPVGDFLFAVFSNQFVETIGKADSNNISRLRHYAEFLYGAAPASPVKSWGSPEIVREWQKMGGMRGLEKRLEERRRDDAQEGGPISPSE